jgi:hypothetical protein
VLYGRYGRSVSAPKNHFSWETETDLTRDWFESGHTAPRLTAVIRPSRLMGIGLQADLNYRSCWIMNIKSRKAPLSRSCCPDRQHGRPKPDVQAARSFPQSPCVSDGRAALLSGLASSLGFGVDCPTRPHHPRSCTYRFQLGDHVLHCSSKLMTCPPRRWNLFGSKSYH